MALIAIDTSKSNFKPVPAGNHIGRCYRVIDLGTQKSEYQGQVRKVRQVSIGWELFGEDENGQPLTTEGGFPLIISKRYTLSLNEKAKLRADLESLRGHAFNTEELKGFDMRALLGKYGMINVKLKEHEGKTYSSVASLSPLPKIPGLQQPKGVNDLQYFDVSEPDDAVFNKLHKQLQEIIHSCDEWKSRESAQSKTHCSVPATDDFPDDDVPF